jgi:hypothetical protein
MKTGKKLIKKGEGTFRGCVRSSLNAGGVEVGLNGSETPYVSS